MVTKDTTPTDERILVGAIALLEILFPDEASRPKASTLDRWRRRGLVPYHRVGGRKVFYDPQLVRRALDKNFKVEEVA